ncbi:tetratricopeptide repeat protein [Novosphingobium sp. B1]|uniref:tetratricopeptide repeat protein n=1 Tax=Novosphingobium sp. B1 TaxID=1938756 RepID=UPI0009D8052C|nr:tetratricopeptide repeat protein [Novosphingobium sp. B1]SMC30775.1 Cytochrome c-type biogenesis protein CcmH/NrfG [Novosphingobium sp. B1]
MICSSNTISTARALAAAVLLTLFSAGTVRGDAPRDLLAEARTALDRGDAVSAEVRLRSALKSGVPADAVRASLGQALLEQGNLGAAREILYAGDFAPTSAAEGWHQRGRLELAEGRLPEAGLAFDRSYRLAPDDAGLWTDIARLRFTGGEQAQAIEAAERAVKLGPRDPRALEMRGLLVREQFGLVAALPWFEAGLRSAPEDVSLLGEYAATLGELGHYRAMLVVCRKLAKIDPANVRALYLQAVLAARAGQTTLARKILLSTKGALRDMPAALLLNGVLEYRAGNANLAVGFLDRLVRMQPDNMQARMLLARALVRQRLSAEAVEVLQDWAPRDFAPRYMVQTMGMALAQLGRKQDATRYFERVRSDPTEITGVLPAGQAVGVLALSYAERPNIAATTVPYLRGLLDTGDAGRAVAVAQQLQRANPGTAEAWLLFGDARLLDGDHLGALDAYGRAALIRFNWPTLRRLDQAMRLAGRPAEANALVARYLMQNPGNPQALKLLAAGRVEAGNEKGATAIETVLVERGLRNPS